MKEVFPSPTPPPLSRTFLETIDLGVCLFADAKWLSVHEKGVLNDSDNYICCIDDSSGRA